jgi:hypothetical protein
MSANPKQIEEKMLKVLNALKTIAPDKTFGGITLAQYEAQTQKSLAPRNRLKELDDQTMQQIIVRTDEDGVTHEMIQMIVAGIVADPTEGPNSALYEACGYVRKDNRKSGLTRKRVKNEVRAVKS